MRKYFLIVFCFFCFIQQNTAQNSNRNSWITFYPSNTNYPLTENEKIMISAAYEKETLKKLYSSKPLIKDIKDILRNRVKIIKENQKNISSYPLLSSIKNDKKKSKLEFKSENFNPLEYNFNYNLKKNQFFRVDNSNYLIIIKPKIIK